MEAAFPLPTEKVFNDVDCFIHQSWCRLRVRAEALKADPSAAQDLVLRLQALSGITSVDLRTLTGSLVIRFDDNALPAAQIVNFLASQGVLPKVVGFPVRNPRAFADRDLSESPLPPRMLPIAKAVSKTAVRILLPVIVGHFFGRTARNFVAAVV